MTQTKAQAEDAQINPSRVAPDCVGAEPKERVVWRNPGENAKNCPNRKT